MRLKHPLGENAGDVFKSADADDLAFEILDFLDLRLGKQRIRRRLDHNANERHRRAFVDGPDRIDHAGAGRNSYTSRQRAAG